MDFKTSIAENIANIENIDFKEISDFVEVPKEKSNGDFSFPCFKLAKNLKKAPQMIAEELKTSLKSKTDFMELFDKVDVINGFLNFYVSKVHLVREATEKLSNVYQDEHLRIVGLIDDYETLNNQILEHRKQKALEGKQSAENEQSAAKANLDLAFNQLGT